MFIYKYHTEVGITFPYGYMPRAASVGGPSTQLLAQPGALAALLAGGGGGAPGASGAGVQLPSGLSAAEVSHHLTPGSSGHSPFDQQRYPGFCRKMRAPNVPDLQVQRMWLTGKQRNATDVTLVTQLSVDRLYMLEGQCGAWGSVISAAVHVTLVQVRACAARRPPACLQPLCSCCTPRHTEQLLGPCGSPEALR